MFVLINDTLVNHEDVCAIQQVKPGQISVLFYEGSIVFINSTIDLAMAQLAKVTTIKK